MAQTNINQLDRIEARLHIHIAPSVGTDSDCCDMPGAKDYDVTLTVTFDGSECTVDGAVTLVPDRGGRLSSWGDLDHWLSSDLVEVVCALGDEGRRLASEIEAACRAGEPSEIELTGEAVAERGRADGIEDVQNVLEEQGLDTVAATLRPGHVEWDEGARNAGAHQWREIPDALEQVYYDAYAKAARAECERVVGEARQKSERSANG